MLRKLFCAGFCLLILLAMGSGAKGTAAGQIGQVQLNSGNCLASMHATPFGRGAHLSNPISDDGVTLSIEGLQANSILTSAAFLLTMLLLLMPRTGRDLLSLTQRRRE